MAKPDCYDYIRTYYGVPAYIGVKVRVLGKDGVLVNAPHMQHYAHVRFDGEARVKVFHPTDGIEYFPLACERKAATR